MNPYNFYDYCFNKYAFLGNLKKEKRYFHSQQSTLEGIKRSLNKKEKINQLFLGSLLYRSCGYLDGVFNYFSQNSHKYGMDNALKIQLIDPEGSISSYHHLIDLMESPNRSIKIILYNGNWDAVVPLYWYTQRHQNFRPKIEFYSFAMVYKLATFWLVANFQNLATFPEPTFCYIQRSLSSSTAIKKS